MVSCDFKQKETMKCMKNTKKKEELLPFFQVDLDSVDVFE